jgi:methylated-DNA-[protein]-cysteine S-methyltransferase
MSSFTCIYTSPIGDLFISAQDEKISCISFNLKPDAAISSSSATDECCRQLDGYFNGSRMIFDLPVSQSGTPFQQQVWTALKNISYGKTASYHHVSKQLGNVKAIRAVGNANGKNNVAIVVPCHRVIGSNGDLVGYAGELWRKKWLLQHEAKFASGVQTLF